MALIKCSECGKEISDKAAACPNCGCPISEMNVTPIDSSRPDENPVGNISQKPAKKKNKSLPCTQLEYKPLCGISYKSVRFSQFPLHDCGCYS